MQQPQACSISRSFIILEASVAEAHRLLVQEPSLWGNNSQPACERQRRTSMTVAPASAPHRAVSHHAAAASLLDQSELHHGGFRCNSTPPAGAGAWSWRQALATRARVAAKNEHAPSFVPCARLRLAPCSSRKLARSVGASSWLLRCHGTPPAGWCSCLSRCQIFAASTIRHHASGTGDVRAT